MPSADASAPGLDVDLISPDGELIIHTSPLSFSSGHISGAWDDVTGGFVGDLAGFDSITIPAVPPVFPTEGIMTIGGVGEGNLVGTIDPSTGAANLRATMRMTIYIPAIETTCTTSTFELALTTEAPGYLLTPAPYDGSTEVSIGLTGAMTVPAFDLDTGCDPLAQLAPLLNNPLGLPAQWRVVLPFDGTITEPPPSSTSTSTTSPTPTTTASPTSVSAAAATKPRFTG